jgi:hypothetical protein
MNINRQIFASAILIPFVILTFAINEFVNNAAEFNNSLSVLVVGLLVSLVAFVFLLIVVGNVLPKKIRKYYIALTYAIAILLWFQGIIVNWNYGVLTGAPIEWENYSFRFFIDVIVWAFVLTISLFYARIFLKYSTHIILFIMITQSLSTVIAIYSYKGSSDSHYFTLISNDRMKFSPDQNVVIIMLDAFQSDIFQQIIDEDASYKKTFEGFTYFRNTTSQYSKTYGAVPALLTGRWYTNQEPIQAYLDSSFSESISTKLKSHDWNTQLYPAIPRIIGYSEAYASNISRAASYKEIAEDTGMLIDLALFRGFPQPAKPMIINDMQWRIKNIFPDISNRNVTNVDLAVEGDFYHPIQRFVAEVKGHMTTDSEKSTFKFFHFLVPHEPFVLNENLNFERLPSNREGFKRYSMAGLNAVKTFLEELKLHGTFDSTMIFIVSDHGGGEYNPGVRLTKDIYEDISDSTSKIPPMHHQSGLALLLAKPFGHAKSFDISDKPVSIGDIPYTISNVVEKDFGYEGENIFSEVPLERERRYLFYEFEGWTHSHLPAMTEYVVKGHAWLPSSWKATGKRFAPVVANSGILTSNVKLTPLKIYRPSELVSKNVLGKGWSYLEGSSLRGVSVWSNKKSASITIVTEQATDTLLSLKLNPNRCGGTLGGQRVLMKHDDEIFYEFYVSKNDAYSIPLKKSFFDQQKKVHLTLEMPDAISPLDCQSGLDNRLLGVSLTELTVNPINKISAWGLKVNEKVSFAAVKSRKYIATGWSDQEEAHRWTEGSKSSLLLFVQRSKNTAFRLKLFGNGRAPKGQEHQLVKVMVNNQQVAEWQVGGLAWYEALIPADVAGSTGQPLQVDFLIDEPTAPCEVSDSQDCRKLGLAVRELVIERQ